MYIDITTIKSWLHQARLDLSSWIHPGERVSTTTMSTTTTNTTTTPPPAPLPDEAQLSLLQAKLRLVTEGLHRIGYEKDGPNKYIERFGVDAAACRRLLSMIGAPTHTAGQQLGGALSPQRTDAGKPQQVTWSKHPTGIV